MGKKKKDDLKATVEDYKFNPAVIPEPTIDVTTLNDRFVHHIPSYEMGRSYVYEGLPYRVTTTGGTISPDIWSSPYTGGTIGPDIWSPPYTVDPSAGSVTIDAWHKYHNLKEWRETIEKEAVGDVNIIERDGFKGEHIVACKDQYDLSTGRVLKTLSAAKGKLMIDIAPVRIKDIECRITPNVRRNIITASKKLKMYGKKRPLISRFDDYGNKLPDEIDLDMNHGITLKIVDPEDYGDLYLEIRAIEFPDADSSTDYLTKTWTSIDEDLPF